MQKFHWWFFDEDTGLMKCSLEASITFQDYTAVYERLILVPGKSIWVPPLYPPWREYPLWTWIESDLTLGWRRE